VYDVLSITFAARIVLAKNNTAGGCLNFPGIVDRISSKVGIMSIFAREMRPAKNIFYNGSGPGILSPHVFSR
jgi:hypothetical protein